MWDVPSGGSRNAVSKKMTLHHTKVINAFAFHPTERIIAAGDVTGRVLIWRGFGNRKLALGSQKKNARSMVDLDNPGVRDGDDAESCTTWHWHSAEVNVLNFSSDGAYLYSGEAELLNRFAVSKVYGLSSYSVLLTLFSRGKGRGACRLAARHWEEEVFTKDRVSLVVLHLVSRTNSFFCKSKLCCFNLI